MKEKDNRPKFKIACRNEGDLQLMVPRLWELTEPPWQVAASKATADASRTGCEPQVRCGCADVRWSRDSEGRGRGRGQGRCRQVAWISWKVFQSLVTGR